MKNKNRKAATKIYTHIDKNNKNHKKLSPIDKQVDKVRLKTK